MSSQQFENYETDFQSRYEEVRRKIRERLPHCSGEERKKLIREIERGIENGNFLVQEMEEETKHAPPVYRTPMVGKVRNYRRDLDQLSRDVKRSNSEFGGSAYNFGYDGSTEFANMEASQRTSLMAGVQSLNNTSDSIARSHQISAETDQIGTDIIDELGRQRESLERTKDRLGDTDDNLSRSRKILKSMGRRLVTNKLLLAVIIFVELAILAGVIYWKFFSKSKK